MTWQEIKISIRKQLLSRNLSNPNIRLNALEKIETLVDKNILANPNKLLSIDKQAFKDSLLLDYFTNIFGEPTNKGASYYWAGENIGYSLIRNTNNSHIMVGISSMQ